MKIAPQPQPRKIRRNSASAFTLVELLVVIGIIAIIAGIAFPFLSASRKSAEMAQCAGNLRQIGAACLAYAAENSGTLPASDQGGTWPASTYMVQINPYLANLPTSTFPQQKEVCFGGVFRCPGKRDYKMDGPSDMYRVSYGMNTFAPTTIPNTGPVLLSIEEPAKTVLVADLQTGYWALRNADYMYKDFKALRHNRQDNILFCDGHVELVPKNGLTWNLSLKQ